MPAHLPPISHLSYNPTSPEWVVSPVREPRLATDGTSDKHLAIVMFQFKVKVGSYIHYTRSSHTIHLPE